MDLLLLLDEQLRRLTFSWLLLLPIVAAILILQGTWLNNGSSARGRSSKHQRRLKTKVLIHRALIVNLLLAAFIVFRSSLTVLPDIVQGLLLTVILMLPVLLYLFIVVLKVKVKPTLPAVETLEQNNQASEQPEIASNSVAVSESVFDHTQSVDQGTMPATNHGELTEKLANLQNDKIKLLKLVIAQKAVIETEKQLRQNANVMTHDAMTVLRRARDGARVAIRVARRERRERLRFEADNAKVRRQLENAMSAIRTKEQMPL